MQIVVLILPESPFGWASHHIATKCKVGGNFATVKNQTINTHNAQHDREQNNKLISGVSGKQGSGSKTGPANHKISKIDS